MNASVYKQNLSIMFHTYLLSTSVLFKSESQTDLQIKKKLIDFENNRLILTSKNNYAKKIK